MTRGDRRAIAFGTVTILTAWLLFRGGPAMVAKADALEAGIAQRKELLTRSLERLGTIPALTDSLERLEHIADSLPTILLAAGSASDAHVDLMDRARTIVAPLAATVRGFSGVEMDASAGPLRLAAIDMTIESDFAGVLEVAEALEEHPALSIQELQVDAGSVDEVASDMEILSTRIRISGWYLPSRAAEELP